MNPPPALSDTIVACATPAGQGAIAVVRLSGPQALELGRTLAPGERQSHRLAVATLHDAANDAIDRGMIVEMHGPHSYTGEDVVELHLHGSRAVVSAVLHRCTELGARPANPGEYTLRAFLNGRMSLDQAEAVGDLIASRNDRQRQVAVANAAGWLSKQIEGALNALEVIQARWQAALDFPEYPTGEGWQANDGDTLHTISCMLQELIEGARLEMTRGRRVVLCGAPNVGKSSLLNAWAGRQRVLVDDAPGTTRDPVEVSMAGEMSWTLWDTAGLREGTDGLEHRGIAMTHERIAEADLVLWLVDPTNPVWPPELQVPLAIVGSKADLAGPRARQAIEAKAGDGWLGWVSSLTGEGLQIKERLAVGGHWEGSRAVVRERHVAALSNAHTHILELLSAQRDGIPLDMLSNHLREGIDGLGEILGRNVDAAVLDRIFASFCIGK